MLKNKLQPGNRALQPESVPGPGQPGSTRRSAIAIGALTAGLLFAPLAAGATVQANAIDAPRTSKVSTAATPARLLQSTGNLYWTSNGATSSKVYRTSKNAVPGDERVIFQASHSGQLRFGALTFARVGSGFFFYVVVNNVVTGKSQIWRLPGNGSSLKVFGGLPGFINTRDLTTDGTSLFWADGGGIRKMPLAGGLVRTLDSGSGFSKLGLDGDNVYYSAGVRIRVVAKSGGSSSTVVRQAGIITSLFVRHTIKKPVLYWGEDNAAVRHLSLTTGSRFTYQPPIAGRKAKSVSWDGSRVLWIDCANAGGQCRTVKRVAGFNLVVSSGQLGALDVQGDADQMFWGRVGAVMKHQH